MFFTIVCTNLLYWYQMGFPFAIIVPLLWVGSIAAEMFLQISFQERTHKRRLLTYVGLLMCLMCEVMLWVLKDAAYPFYITYHMAAAVLLGSVVGKVGYMILEMVRERKKKQ